MERGGNLYSSWKGMLRLTKEKVSVKLYRRQGWIGTDGPNRNVGLEPRVPIHSVSPDPTRLTVVVFLAEESVCVHDLLLMAIIKVIMTRK